jgi:hypothetical protein
MVAYYMYKTSSHCKRINKTFFGISIYITSTYYVVVPKSAVDNARGFSQIWK